MENFWKSVVKRFGTVALLACVSAQWTEVQAATATTGKISQMDVATAGNLPFRVYLEGSPVLCTGGMAEGYVDDANANYKTYVAALMFAKATGATVTLYSDVGSNGRCRIDYVSVR